MVRPSPYDPAVLIEGVLPEFDVVERHRIRVRAPADRAYEAVRALDLGRSPVAMALFAVRGLLRMGRGPRARSFKLDDAGRLGFVVLAEEPGVEFVLGLVGRFWQLRGGIRRVEPEAFEAFAESGFAKAAWNFPVDPLGPSACMVRTETRVLCTDPESQKKFLRYWRVIGPFSGFIRREALRLIKRDAERGRATPMKVTRRPRPDRSVPLRGGCIPGPGRDHHPPGSWLPPGLRRSGPAESGHGRRPENA